MTAEALVFFKGVNSIVGIKSGIESFIFGSVHEILSSFADDLLLEATRYIKFAEQESDGEKHNIYIERAILKLESALPIYEKTFQKRTVSNSILNVGSRLTLGVGLLLAEPIKYLTRPKAKARNYWICYFSLATCYIHRNDVKPLEVLLKRIIEPLAITFSPEGTWREYAIFHNKCCDEYGFDMKHLSKRYITYDSDNYGGSEMMYLNP